ncbi:hypothetical protein GIB67_041250 [Kingdonia uniflora]|uniref:RRM domain-containing protein n=1 Tax=Kingdonia uniflora TaxID=39325 RepID=A0A7J7LM65_9MAGN|nr:hypothetical protein GIB67_041250 [Kingdonia uniflora]
MVKSMAEETTLTEIEERVDLDDDNYVEEMDDDVEEPLDEERVEDEGLGEELMQEEEEEDDDDEEEEEQEPLQTEEQQAKDSSPAADEPHGAVECIEDKERPIALKDVEGKNTKYAELLALPPHGSEVFVGGILKEVKEEDLRDLCASIDEGAEIKLVKDKSTGENKGYAFISFKTKELAQKAIEEFHNKEFKGRTLRCSLSQSKHRLFIGNLPKTWSEEEFKKLIEENGPGAENIELIKVKALYVKNLPENTSTEKLKEVFQQHGEITKVVLPPGKAGKRDFGYVYFAERSSALKALKETEKYELDGNVLEVALAKPQSDRRSESSGSYPYKQGGVLPGYLPQAGYGYPRDPYGSSGAGYGSPSFQQPMIYGRGPMPAGMQMVPMVLPDGRLGYVLQQPGAQAPPALARRNDRRNDRSDWNDRNDRNDRTDRNDRNDRSSGSRGRGGSPDGNRGGRRYRPY